MERLRAFELDISKAFAKVWLVGLLHNLKASGVVSPILCILESFLQKRSLKVVLEGGISWCVVLWNGVTGL